MRVYIGGWGEDGCVVDESDCPLASVDEPVMVSTKEDEVFELGGSTPQPRENMMGVTYTRWSVAPWKRTSLVPEDECSSDVCWDHVGGDGDVQGF